MLKKINETADFLIDRMLEENGHSTKSEVIFYILVEEVKKVAVDYLDGNLSLDKAIKFLYSNVEVE